MWNLDFNFCLLEYKMFVNMLVYDDFEIENELILVDYEFVK